MDRYWEGKKGKGKWDVGPEVKWDKMKKNSEDGSEIARATVTWGMQLASGVVYVNKVMTERQEDKGRE